MVKFKLTASSDYVWIDVNCITAIEGLGQNSEVFLVSGKSFVVTLNAESVIKEVSLYRKMVG